jgi:hypothetical protein
VSVCASWVRGEGRERDGHKVIGNESQPSRWFPNPAKINDLTCTAACTAQLQCRATERSASQRAFETHRLRPEVAHVKLGKGQQRQGVKQVWHGQLARIRRTGNAKRRQRRLQAGREAQAGTQGGERMTGSPQPQPSPSPSSASPASC